MCFVYLTNVNTKLCLVIVLIYFHCKANFMSMHSAHTRQNTVTQHMLHAKYLVGVVLLSMSLWYCLNNFMPNQFFYSQNLRIDCKPNRSRMHYFDLNRFVRNQRADFRLESNPAWILWNENRSENRKIID